MITLIVNLILFRSFIYYNFMCCVPLYVHHSVLCVWVYFKSLLMVQILYWLRVDKLKLICRNVSFVCRSSVGELRSDCPICFLFVQKIQNSKSHIGEDNLIWILFGSNWNRNWYWNECEHEQVEIKRAATTTTTTTPEYIGKRVNFFNSFYRNKHTLE